MLTFGLKDVHQNQNKEQESQAIDTNHIEDGPPEEIAQSNAPNDQTENQGSKVKETFTQFYTHIVKEKSCIVSYFGNFGTIMLQISNISFGSAMIK